MATVCMCVMVLHVQIEADVARALFKAAIDMIRRKQKRRVVSGRSFESVIQTTFERVTDNLVEQYEFHANVDLGSTSGDICFRVPVRFDAFEAIGFVAIEHLTGRCPGAHPAPKPAAKRTIDYSVN